MNYSEVKGLSAAELKSKVKEAKAELFEARMKHSLGQLANPMELRRLRKDIARMNTASAAGEIKGATKSAAPKKAPKKTTAAKRGRK